MTDLDVVVVGAGFAGIYAVKAHRDAGLSVRAFEAGGGIGGTWLWNAGGGMPILGLSPDLAYKCRDARRCPPSDVLVMIMCE